MQHPFSDLGLSRRLELAEGYSCARFVEARAKIRPDSGAVWRRFGGVFAAFDGIGSPITQTFGLGVLEPATPEILDEIEDFFRQRGSSVDHEVSPLAGVETYALLVGRGYTPIELTSILYQTPSLKPAESAVARAIDPASESAIWNDINRRAWCHDMPDLGAFLSEMGAIQWERSDVVRFLAFTDDGVPAAAAALNLNEGVALLAGAATLPEMRGRGLQNALLHARLNYAARAGCELAMMGALPGGTSQKNAERNGFRIAYTRTKWKLK